MDDYDIVAVFWNDAWADHDHSTESSWDESWPVISIGFLVSQDDSVLHVAQEIHSSNGSFRCTSHIPRAIITRTEIIRKVRVQAPPTHAERD